MSAQEKTYKFNVVMTCSGCSGAVTRALKKVQESGDISSFDVKLEEQEVLVKGTMSLVDVEAKIAKTGKKVVSGAEVENVNLL